LVPQFRIFVWNHYCSTSCSKWNSYWLAAGSESCGTQLPRYNDSLLETSLFYYLWIFGPSSSWKLFKGRDSQFWTNCWDNWGKSYNQCNQGETQNLSKSLFVFPQVCDEGIKYLNCCIYFGRKGIYFFAENVRSYQ